MRRQWHKKEDKWIKRSEGFVYMCKNTIMLLLLALCECSIYWDKVHSVHIGSALLPLLSAQHCSHISGSTSERVRESKRRKECWMVCFCFVDSNEVSNGELSAAWRDQRPRDTVETRYTHTHYIHTNTPASVTPGQLPPTTNYCSSHMAVALKPLGHVWIELWCGLWSTNRHEAELLKTTEWGRHNQIEGTCVDQPEAACF